MVSDATKPKGRLRSRITRRKKAAPLEAGAPAPGAEPEGDEPVLEGPRRGFYILPNLLTTASLMLGFYSTCLSFGAFINPKSGLDYFVRAGWAIFAAIIFDGLDGRVARLTRTTSSFGMQYDSLSDLVSFGVAPAALVYNFSLRWGWHNASGQGFGWVVALLFMLCGALRLARFNITTEKLPQGVFQGLAIPGAAAGLTFTILLFHELDWVTPQGTSNAYWVFFILTVALALLMVSKVYYPNFKTINIHKRRPFSTFLIVILALVIVFDKPVVTLFVMFFVYILSGPVLWLLKRKPPLIAESEAKPAE